MNGPIIKLFHGTSKLGNDEEATKLKEELMEDFPRSLFKQWCKIYTGNKHFNSRTINGALWVPTLDIYPWIASFCLLFLIIAYKLLINKHPIQSTQNILYRGCPYAKIDDFIGKENTTYHWRSFISTCNSEGSAQTWIKGNPNGILFTIENAIGWDIRKFSCSAHENEILLPPGLNFLIVSAEKGRNFHEVTLDCHQKQSIYEM